VLLVGAIRLPAGEPILSEGFEHFYNLEYPEAIKYFEAEIARDRKDPEAYNHLAQALLYSEMYKAGALESELVSGSNPFVHRELMRPSSEVARRFDDCIAASMRISEARIEKDPNDRAALYALGVAHGLRANYNYLVRKAWMDALKDATAARKLHNQVLELDPKFIDARLVQGVHDYILGSLPWHIKVLGFLAGFKGDREAGLDALRTVAEKGTVNKYDARVLLAAIYRRERRPLEALPLLKHLSERFPRNFLFRLEMVQMYSDAGNKNDALAVLDTVEKLRKAKAPGYADLASAKIDYYRGNLLFWYREYDLAIENLRRVTPDAKDLDLHTAVMAWMRLGQSLDMKGRRKEAIAAYHEAVRTGPETAPGKESKGYINSPWHRSS
jgi:tetratricopeptide (TPR) repeat protein